MFIKSASVRFKGIEKYEGSADEICSSIVKDRWNGRFFETGKRNYSYFWTRDFGITIESLLKLGYKKEVLSTLDYALKIFSKNNRITTAIYKDTPFNFPDVYSPDSVSLFLRSLRIAGAGSLIEKHEDFLNKEVSRFYDKVLDEKTGLVKRNTHFSGMRDYSVRDSSCYDNIMLAMLKDELKKIRVLDNPFKEYSFKKMIKEKFWTGSYFLDDLSGRTHITGDANVFPFWTGVFTEKSMLKKTIESIQSAGLDNPLPLKYISGKAKENTIAIGFLVPDWEKNTVWPMMGPLYIQLIKKVDKQKAGEYMIKYKEIIERYRNYLEIYTVNSKPYKSLFYFADEGMLWAANYLALR